VEVKRSKETMPPGYKTQSPDTSYEAEQILIEHYRKMEPWQKIEKMRQLNDFAARAIFAEVQSRYPDAPEREIWLRVASRYIPADLMIKRSAGILTRWATNRERVWLP
jgi:hypothetical protein